MANLFPNLPIQTTQHTTFVLPCPVRRAIIYLSDPAIVFAALPSVERVIQRQRGTFRLLLAPIGIVGAILRPSAEVLFATSANRVTICSTLEEPHNLRPGEVPARIIGVFDLTAAKLGCAVQASLTIAADVPTHVFPPLIPHAIAERTAEALLIHRMKEEVAALTRDLVHGYPAWEADAGSKFGGPGSGAE